MQTFVGGLGGSEAIGVAGVWAYKKGSWGNFIVSVTEKLARVSIPDVQSFTGFFLGTRKRSVVQS